jgi:hypothetical protein
METLKLLVQVIMLLSSTLMLSSCTSGWSVGSFELSSEDSMYTFLEVMDQDSTSHFYADRVRINSDNWCFTHNQWESVREHE